MLEYRPIKTRKNKIKLWHVREIEPQRWEPRAIGCLVKWPFKNGRRGKSTYSKPQVLPLTRRNQTLYSALLARIKTGKRIHRKQVSQIREPSRAKSPKRNNGKSKSFLRLRAAEVYAWIWNRILCDDRTALAIQKNTCAKNCADWVTDHSDQQPGAWVESYADLLRLWRADCWLELNKANSV